MINLFTHLCLYIPNTFVQDTQNISANSLLYFSNKNNKQYIKNNKYFYYGEASIPHLCMFCVLSTHRNNTFPLRHIRDRCRSV